MLTSLAVFRVAINWLLVAMWMTFIFVGSTDVLSSHHTSRFLGPFLRWINPSFSDAQLREVQFFIRKCGHLSEYAVLGLLLWNARRVSDVKETGTFLKWARFALLVSALYASTDEFHQAFIPSRESAVLDVFIDTCGAAAALFFLWLMGRWRKYW